MAENEASQVLVRGWIDLKRNFRVGDVTCVNRSVVDVQLASFPLV